MTQKQGRLAEEENRLKSVLSKIEECEKDIMKSFSSEKTSRYSQLYLLKETINANIFRLKNETKNFGKQKKFNVYMAVASMVKINGSPMYIMQ